MQTSTTQTHEIPIERRDEVIKLLQDALDNPDFSSFHSYVSNKWENLTGKPTPHFFVQIEMVHKNATDK